MTTNSPDNIRSVPFNTGEFFADKRYWILHYYGALCYNGRQMQLKFDLKKLQVGQTVGLRITPSGDLNCYIDSIYKGTICTGLPTNSVSYWGIFDVFGNIAKLQLITPKEAIPKSSVSKNSRRSVKDLLETQKIEEQQQLENEDIQLRSQEQCLSEQLLMNHELELQSEQPHIMNQRLLEENQELKWKNEELKSENQELHIQLELQLENHEQLGQQLTNQEQSELRNQELISDNEELQLRNQQVLQELQSKSQELKELKLENQELRIQLELQLENQEQQFEQNELQPELQIKVQELLSEKQELQSKYKEILSKLQEVELKNKELQEKLSHIHSNDQPKTNITDESWKVNYKEVTLTKQELGRGGWGVIWIGEFRSQNVAVKQMHELIVSPEFLQLLNREIGIMAQLRHPNLLQFIGAVLDHPSGNPMIITEIMDISLRGAYEKKQLSPVPVSICLSIMRDVAVGLNYLHSLPDPIIHRDVSSANVLLESKGPGKWKTKISDFGSAKLARSAVTKAAGAAVYSAPEAFQGVGIIHKKKQTTKMDVYSYGVLLWEVMTCTFPNGDIFHNFLEQIKTSSPSIHQLILQCISEDPQHRPTMKQVIQQIDDIA